MNPTFSLKVRPGHPDFLDLPWMRSIVDWPDERFVELPRAGVWTFGLASDDGSRLRIDGGASADNLLGAPVDPETSISVNWDDSYIVSEAERTSQLREDALAGLVPRCRYLSARYGLSEDEAHRWAAEAKADSQTDEQLTFGGA